MGIHSTIALWSSHALVASAILLAGCGELHSAERASPRIEYLVEIERGNGDASVTITIDQSDGEVRLLDFKPKRHSEPTADGDLDLADGRWAWKPPKRGGSLEFKAPLNHTRRNGSTDGEINDDWGIFRGDDLVPPARAVFDRDVRPNHWLKVDLPKGWSYATPYGREPGEWLAVEDERRLFDRPTGWFIVGNIGTRKDTIAGSEVIIAGPKGQGVRRLDMLALVRWTLPELARVFGPPPDPILVVSTGDPFFRGGLAAPTSLYMHRERPLISENGTSSLAHELVHLMLPPAASANADWIVEGLAEFYSVESLRRSGTVSSERSVGTYEQLAAWGRAIRRLDDGQSTGPETARAVTLFKQLDDELKPDHSLDDVAALLARQPSLSKESLLEAIKTAAGDVPRGFRRELARLTDSP